MEPFQIAGLIWIASVGIGIFGSMFIATLIYNLNYYRRSKIDLINARTENLRLQLKLNKEAHKKDEDN